MIDPYFEAYNPHLYREFTVTNEGDGWWRIYSGAVQRGYAPSKDEAHAVIDRYLARKTI